MDQLDTEDTDAGAWTAERHVTSLYQAHALSLARLALVMLGDASAAEDVVQDAFLGLYRRWDHLADPAVAPSYLRTSVLNGCRTALRHRSRRGILTGGTAGAHDEGAFAEPTLESAEATVARGEEHRAVLAAIRRLPIRQREALVLRYYLDMTEDQAAEAMRVSRGTVKSATSRAVAAVGRMLGAPVSTSRPRGGLMNSVEDQVRAATRAQAATLRAVRPLRLTPAAGDVPEAAPPSTPRARRRSVFRSPAWLAPIAAAAVVLVLALTLVIIKDLPNGRAVPPVPPTSSSTAGVPRYYAAPETTCPTCQSTRLVVGDTFTGAKLATFTPPQGTTFEAVAAAGNDRTFVADTVKFPFSVKTLHVTWYLLKITPGSSSPARLTRLPISAPLANARFMTIAVSASGRELALAFQLQDGPSDTTMLRTYSLPSGKLLHSWSTNRPVSVGSPSDLAYAQSNNGLSWIDGDRALAFSGASYTGNAEQGDIEHITVRTLNATARGGDLLADSRVVWSMQAPVLDLDWPALTPGNESTCAAGLELPSLTAGGKAVVCSTVSGTPGLAGDGKTSRYRWRLAWLAYAIAAPKVARTLHAFTAYSTDNVFNVSSSSVQWADASGSTMIVAWTIPSAAAPVTHFGLIAQGRLIPLPSPPGITLGTPPDIAW